VPPPIVVALIAVLSLVGIGVTIWVYRPAFGGSPEAARRDIGTHRLALGGVVSVLVLAGLLSIPLAPLVRSGEQLTAGTFALAALATEIPMMVFVYFRLIRPGAVTWEELGLRPIRPAYALSMGIGVGLVGLVAIDVVGTLLSQVGLRPNQLEQFAFVLNEGPLAFVLLLISAGVIAPVVEELFFRGFLFGLYRRRQPLWVAYLVSSVIFTALHLEPQRMNAAQMGGLAVGIFILAMLLAWLYQRTGSLYPGMLAHAVNNATGLILFYAVGLR
jgi:membrane protease YdiL (CAAX protease family)